MRLLLLAAALLFASVAWGQEPGDSPVAVSGTGGQAALAMSDAPHLFLDCPVCDENFIREDVAFVVYVRDRADADVHAIVSYLPTSSGGYEYTLRFIGLGRFLGTDGENTVRVDADVSADENRRALGRGLRVGLAPYAARTSVARELDVIWTPAEAPPAGAHDPWNRWIVSLGANGSFVGESSYRASNSNGSVTAARVTDLWKIRAQTYLYLIETRYEFESGEVAESFRRDVGASFLAGRAFGDHVSAGLRPSWSASTYTNTRSQYSSYAVFEWSVFPYSEASRRALVFRYRPRVDRAIYYEETIFDKEEEILFSESASLAFDTTQPWGSVTASVSGSHYFHDVSKAQADASLLLSMRLVRGLSLTLSGTVSLVRGQLYLPKAGATEQEALLRRRQLATQYDYTALVGLSYVFGSIYTPVVNTRFD